jgi:hypothetical protein
LILKNNIYKNILHIYSIILREMSNQYSVNRLSNGSMKLISPSTTVVIPAEIARGQIVNPRTGQLVNYRPAVGKKSSKWVFKSEWQSGNYYLTDDFKLKKKLSFRNITPKAVLFSTKYRGILQAYRVEKMDRYIADYEAYIDRLQSVFVRLCTAVLNELRQARVQIVLDLIFKRKIGDEYEYVNYYPSTPFASISDPNHLDDLYDTFKQRFLDLIEAFEQNGSGWLFETVNDCNIKFARYRPLRGGSYIKTPPNMMGHFRNAGVINIKNENDHECFRRAVLSALHPPKANYARPGYYDKLKGHGIDFSMLTYPVDLSQIKKFESVNGIGVYVHKLADNKKSFYPVYPNNFKLHYGKYSRIVDLIVLDDDSTYHYCSVNKIAALYRSQCVSSSSKRSIWFCRCCCSFQQSKQAHENHIAHCHQNESQQIVMPTTKKYDIPSQIVGRKRRCPVVIYADFESIMKPIDKTKGNKTTLVSEHVMSGWGLYPVAPLIPDIQKVHLDHGEGCELSFLQTLENVGDRAYEALQAHRNTMILSDDEVKVFHESEKCYLCDGEFDDSKQSLRKVRDHCHIDGHYLGAAHSKCNLFDKTTGEIPIFFHNFKGYDSHFVFQTLSKYLENKKQLNLNLIPTSEEKIMMLSIKHLNTPIRFVFKDSFNFLSCSLATLVKDMSENGSVYDGFKHMKNNFNAEQIPLLVRKGVYFYEHATNFEQFEKDHLPSRESFFSSLSQTDISTKDYLHAKVVWNKMECKNRWDYHDLYLKTDILLLADVFEKFRDLSLDLYQLDPTWYVSLPGLSWDACRLKTDSLVKEHGGMDLITDIDMYMMIENAIRGGNSMIVTRFAEANNKYMSNYNKSKPSSFIRYLDMNNLYGGAMCERLPLNDFRWGTPEECDSFDVMSIPEDGDLGCFVECDIKYPNELHDLHNDLPVLAQNVIIPQDKKSDFYKSLCDRLKKKSSKCGKLIPHLYDRTRYVVHYRALRQAVELGLEVTNVHRIIWFNQIAWLKPYIDLNTEQRAKAKNKFEKDFFKLLNNSVFGKTMENVRKHFDMKLCRSNHVDDENRVQKYLNDMRLSHYPSNYNGILGFKMTKKRIVLNKPIAVGASILDLSKVMMYDFHYNYMYKKYDPSRVKLLFTDTDSLCYKIQTDDWFEDIKGDEQLFDFSNYPSDHSIYSEMNKKVVGKMKDEVPGDEIVEWIGLKAKMYSFLTESGINKFTSKGIPKASKTLGGSFLTHDDYRNSYFNETNVPVSMHSIRSYKHNVYTIKMTKGGLSSDDDKRHLLSNNESLSYGHYKLLV